MSGHLSIHLSRLLVQHLLHLDSAVHSQGGAEGPKGKRRSAQGGLARRRRVPPGPLGSAVCTLADALLTGNICSKRPVVRARIQGEDTLEERDADGLFPEDLSSEVLSRHFSLYYDQRTDTREQGKDLRAEREGSGLAGWLRRGLRGVRTQGHLLRTLLVLHAPRFAWHTVLALLTCTVVRAATVLGRRSSTGP